MAKMAFGQTFVVWNSGQDIHINEGIQFVVKDGDFVNNSGHLHNNGRLTVHGDFILNDSVESTNLLAVQPQYQVQGTWNNNSHFIAGNSRTSLLEEISKLQEVKSRATMI